MDRAVWEAFCAEMGKRADAATAPDPHLTARFDRLKDELERNGVYSGTGHKRILVPKRVLTEQDVGALGFVPVKIAIPEAGQTSSRSFRHPDHNYHIHEHGENWTIHRDRHAASTMLVKKMLSAPKAHGLTHPAAQAALDTVPAPPKVRHLTTAVRAGAELVRGLPHVITEGVPGAYYYMKGRLAGVESMGDRVQKELPAEYKRRVSRWVPSTTAKISGMPQDEPAPRTRVQGLKQPRIATPRLNPEVGAKVPSNPFRGNWQKLGSPDTTTVGHGLLGAAALGTGLYTLKRTADQAVSPRPQGVGAGATARTGQRVLLLAQGRVPAGPPSGYPS